MPPRIARRLVLALITAMGFLAAAACRTEPDTEKPAPPPGPTTSHHATPAPSSGSLRNEIPPDALAKVMEAHFKGLGYMEQYEYPGAVNEFRKVHELAPGWIPGSINLAIALLNDSGVKAEEAKKAGGGAPPPPTNFDESLDLLAGVLDREADNPYAAFQQRHHPHGHGEAPGGTSPLQASNGDRPERCGGLVLAG